MRDYDVGLMCPCDQGSGGGNGRQEGGICACERDREVYLTGPGGSHDTRNLDHLRLACQSGRPGSSAVAADTAALGLRWPVPHPPGAHLAPPSAPLRP